MTLRTIDPRIPAIVPGFDAPFFQAGLAGYSDAAMRLVARRHGCPYCVTEALLDRILLDGGKIRAREDPHRLASTLCGDDEAAVKARGLHDHPIAGQVMGSDPGEMARGAAMLASMGYDVIDVNLACPVKKIRKQHRGGHLLGNPHDAITILGAVREAVPNEVPVTVKMRRAFDDSDAMTANFDRIFEAVYELGCAWATVHARTVEQKYKGPSRWPFLADLVRRYDDRIIFGSGDIERAEDIPAMLEQTGVHAVAVARGAIGNPWIFRQARRLLAGEDAAFPTIAEQASVLRAHFELSAALHGESGASRMMRKFGIRFSEHHPQSDAVRAAFIAVESTAEWHAVVDRFYEEGRKWSIETVACPPTTPSPAPCGTS